MGLRFSASVDRLEAVAADVEQVGGRAERVAARPETPADAEAMVKAAVKAARRPGHHRLRLRDEHSRADG